MTYASLADLIARAGELEILQIADRDNDGIPDAAVIVAALTHADNIVNGYVGTRYDLPLGTIPDLIRTWSVSIARYFLHLNGAPEYVEADYKDALAGLKDLSRGLLALPDVEGKAPAGTSSATHMSSIPSPHFSTLRGWLC